MFWGLVLEPGKRYAQTVDKEFHISMASLDVGHSEQDLVTVRVDFQNAEFILCNLQKNKVFQTPLDLNFRQGDRIAFYTTGKGRVHLTGYLLDEDVDEDDLDLEEEDSEDDVPVTPQKNAAQVAKQEKRKSVGQTPGKPALKKNKMEIEDEEDGDDSDSELESSGDSDVEMEVGSGDEEEDDEDDGEEGEDDSDELEEATPQKLKHLGKKEKQLSAQKQQQNKQLNTPNETKKKKSKGLDAVTPSTSAIQENGIAETQSGKKNKKKGGETPGDKGGQTPKQAQAGSPGPQKKILEGGVAIEDTVIGSGPVAKPGRVVTVYYTGRLKQNNKKFDETVQGPGFKFRLGKAEVIKGWDIGVTGMKVGGKRKLIIPPHMAYGAKGSPPIIPPNSALVFEVELRNVN